MAVDKEMTLPPSNASNQFHFMTDLKGHHFHVDDQFGHSEKLPWIDFLNGQVFTALDPESLFRSFQFRHLLRLRSLLFFFSVLD